MHCCPLFLDVLNIKIPSAGSQGLHKLKQFLNLEGFFEKSLNIRHTLKSTENSLKGLEFHYFL